ncbi:YobA family protein [Geobacillus sp. 46C-IIa]|uniref:YobA family protein n=1 Tax=Geobacillus sp. 46C-IIa TaxID=1963025 RepID=UPI001CC1CDAB|nr:YobA family protein [Geobacillus sp. 46C-IIa]
MFFNATFDVFACLANYNQGGIELKKWVVFIAAVWSVWLAGCSGPAGRYAIEGYVVRKEGGSILVVSSDPQDFRSTGGLEEFYNAILVSSAPARVKIGQKVQVWIDGGIAESYPGQGKADKVLVVPSTPHDGARLSEEEAIRQALKQEESRLEHMIPVIQAVDYDKQADTWMIQIKDAHARTGFDVRIKDD